MKQTDAALLAAAVGAHQNGEFERAETLYRRILDRCPDHAGALHLLGLLRFQHGEQDSGLACVRRAVAIDPRNAPARSNLGNMLRELGRAGEAVPLLREAVRLDANFAPALVNLAAALEEEGDLDEAAGFLRRAIRLWPGDARIRTNLGNVLQKQGRNQEAWQCFEEALRLDPNLAEAHNSLGTALEQLGRWEEALSRYEQAVRLKPDLAGAHVNRAMAWLRMGDFERGWPEYEWRLRRPPGPLWKGEPLAGKTILLRAEQGLGDTIQFVRYAAKVQAGGARVLLECPARLAPLMAAVDGIDAVFPVGAALPHFDAQAFLMSLAGVFETRLETIPARTPYLHVGEEWITRWRRRIGQAPNRLRVGLVWSGNPKYSYNLRRSLRLADFAALARLPRVALFSLQRGPQSAELRHAPPGFAVTSLEDEAGGILDTAAAILNLDLVITVDTMAAHLAGALGRPVWVLLPCAADWRWQLQREDSPWYPTMRLFRQPRPGDWTPVMERVVRDLNKLLDSADLSAVEAIR